MKHHIERVSRQLGTPLRPEPPMWDPSPWNPLTQEVRYFQLYNPTTDVTTKYRVTRQLDVPWKRRVERQGGIDITVWYK